MKNFCIKSFLITRIFYLIFAQLIFQTGFISKRDFSADMISDSKIDNISYIEKTLLNWLKVFLSYDGSHFEYIAKNGYIGDHIFCFFPFFPYCARCFVPFFKLFNCKNDNTPFILSGLLFNNILCFLNCLILSNLIFEITKSKEKGKISVLLFLINPGSIFFMAFYSENVYFFLSLLLVKELISNNYNFFYYIKLCLIISGILMTRSNGLVLLSFLIIPIFKKIFEQINQKQNKNFSDDLLFNLKLFIDLIYQNIIFILLHIILCIYGFFFFYWMVNLRPKRIICNYANKLINYNGPTFTDYWNFCNNLKSPIKSIYNYLQNKYWSVSFFNQYKLSNIDKILLSLPMNITGAYLIYKSYQMFNFKSLMKFNLYQFFFSNIEQKKQNIIEETFILGGLINFFVLFLTIILIAYISINNRLYTSHPLLYYWLSDDVLKYLKGENKKGFIILLYFFTFSLLYFIANIGSYNGV